MLICCSILIVWAVWKTHKKDKESIILLIFFCEGALIVGGWGLMEWGKKSYLKPAEIKYLVY